jgi:phosphoribosylanthranilate isomerase
MKIKVCGLKFPGNIEAVTALNPDYMGFIFYGKSPRFVDEMGADILSRIPVSIKKTAVFVNENIETVSELITKYDFDAVQLHGNETPAFCGKLKGNIEVIKAFGVDENFDFGQLNEYDGLVDFFLFDAKTSIHGGSGNTFDWNILNEYKLNIPFFLSGGLSLENIDEIKKINHTQFYGVDLNSRFETAPGMKDIYKLEKAFDIIKHTIHELRS